AVSSPMSNKFNDRDCNNKKINVATTITPAIGSVCQSAPTKLPIIQNNALCTLSSSGAAITIKSVVALKINDNAIPESNNLVVEIRPPTFAREKTSITDKSAPINAEKESAY